MKDTTEKIVAMAQYDWSDDEEAVRAVAEIIGKLPELKARGAIQSYIATDTHIHIQLATPKTGSWKRRFRKER